MGHWDSAPVQSMYISITVILLNLVHTCCAMSKLKCMVILLVPGDRHALMGGT